MDKSLKELIIASFFHDIGKFIQRSDLFKETHSFLSMLFTKVIKEKGGEFLEDNLDWNKIAQLAEFHHEFSDKNIPDHIKKELEIIKNADILAASTERENLNNNLSPYEINQKDIFCFLYQEDNLVSKEYFHRIHSLYQLEKFLPVLKEELQENENKRNYKNLLSKDNLGFFLESVFNTNNKRSFLSLLYSLDDIFNLFYTQIPEDRRDLFQLNSLYDHLKLTTLFTFLYYYGQEFYFLKFDFAGIQKFIFNIKSKKAAKILRGRSLFVQILNEIINFDIIYKLDLIPQVVISNFGGNSYLLLPKKDRLIEDLTKILYQWKKLLLVNYSLTLRTNFFEKTYPIDKDQIIMLFNSKQETFYDKKLFFDLALINNEIQPKSVDDTSLCDFCDNPAELKNNDEEEKICDQCAQFLHLSRYITKAQPFYWQLSPKSIVDEIKFKLFTDLDNKNFDKIFGLKPFENLVKQQENKRSYFPIFSSKTLFYDAVIPEGKTFEDFVKNKKTASVLMYLKGDVDNMSKIFDKGFNFRKNNEKRITDILHFSRRMNLFFQNYLSYLVKNNPEFKDEIYLVYSGGDDFFLLGHWQKVLEFIFLIKDHFDKFVCHNPKIHFSLGGYLAKDHDPVYLIAEKVEEKLLEAKEKGKNKFRFLHSNLKVEEWKNLYEKAKILNKKVISTSFFYTIYGLINEDGILIDSNHYQNAISFYKMSYFYLRLVDSWSQEIIKKNDLYNFIDFFQKIFLVPQSGDAEINFYRKNLKSLINIILLLRRKGGENDE